jgi:hypothetical protein
MVVLTTNFDAIFNHSGLSVVHTYAYNHLYNMDSKG